MKKDEQNQEIEFTLNPKNLTKKTVKIEDDQDEDKDKVDEMSNTGSFK